MEGPQASHFSPFFLFLLPLSFFFSWCFFFPKRFRERVEIRLKIFVSQSQELLFMLYVSFISLKVTGLKHTVTCPC